MGRIQGCFIFPLIENSLKELIQNGFEHVPLVPNPHHGGSVKLAHNPTT
jgi:hypothetical protein